MNSRWSVGDLTLFEALTVRAFDRLNYQYTGKFDQNFSKQSNAYPASRGFSLVFLSVVLSFSSRFWLLAFCLGCFCAEKKTSADSCLGFLLSMRIRYLQDLGGNHMTKPVVEPVLSTRASFFTSLLCKSEPPISTWGVRVFPVGKLTHEYMSKLRRQHRITDT